MSASWEPSTRDDARQPEPVLTRREALARERAASAPRAESTEPPAAAAPQVAAWRRPVAPVRRAVVRGASVTRTRVVSGLRSVRGVAGLAVVVGMFATVIIPAYSLRADGAAFSTSDMFASSRDGAQAVAVSSGAAGQAAAAEQYTSQSAAQVAASRIQSIRLSGSYVPPFQSAGDDYPWWNKRTEYSGGGLSPLGYYYRECVDFVAWRLNRDAGSTGAPWKWHWENLASGSAYVWLSEWRSNGWPTSDVAVPGAVAWFPYNHVAYVKSINADGSVNIEEYNWTGDHLYHARTIQAAEAVYLYPPG